MSGSSDYTDQSIEQLKARVAEIEARRLRLRLEYQLKALGKPEAKQQARLLSSWLGRRDVIERICRALTGASREASGIAREIYPAIRDLAADPESGFVLAAWVIATTSIYIARVGVSVFCSDYISS